MNARGVRGAINVSSVPLLCAQEINVVDSMEKVIRILIHFNGNKKQLKIIHCYLGRTVELRPDYGEKK